MRSLFSFFIVTALGICALAAPLSVKPLQKRSFTVPVRSRSAARVRIPSREVVRTYAKHGWDIIIAKPQDLWVDPSNDESATSPSPTSTSTSFVDFEVDVSGPSSASAAATTSGSVEGEVTSDPEVDDSEYLAAVYIGGQKVYMDFDTGSSDLWVFSTDMPSSDIGQHFTFDPSKSSSWSALDGYTWQIEYGDESTASGTVGTDTVNIGGVVVTKQAVELATAVSETFIDDYLNDGLVGLGFGNINNVQPHQQKTFFANIKDQLKQPVFTANLEDGNGGTYEFGSIDASKFSGDLHFTTVDPTNGFWQFMSPTYSIGGTQSKCSTCSPAIADTGTSLIFLDDDIVQAYWKQVNGAGLDQTQGGYVYPCNATPPDLGIAIGSGYTATVSGSSMNYASFGDNQCFGALQSNNNNGLQILGDAFLKQFFVVFDLGNESFGVAEKA